MENTTAKVCCFARAYHDKNNKFKVYEDPAAALLLGPDYDEIAKSMTAGIGFFLPGFEGTPEEGLRRIVDGQLSPSVLARSAFFESALQTELRLGVKQLVLPAAGYDAFALRSGYPELTVYELDREEMLRDKAARIERAGLVSRAIPVPCDLSAPGWAEKLVAAGFRRDTKSFAAMLGLSYYLSPESFSVLLGTLGTIFMEGSAILFDYPMREESAESGVNRALAQAAGEKMQAAYSYEELERTLSENGFLIYEHLGPSEMTKRFFDGYNRANPAHPMAAPGGVGYVLAVRKETVR